MQLHPSLFLTVLTTVCVRAQNLTGPTAITLNLTELNDLRRCEASCFPEPTVPIKDCESLSDIPCICENLGRVKGGAAPCEEYSCNVTERSKNLPDFDVFCGNLPSESSTILSINAAASSSVVTAASATPSSLGNLGDPTQLSSYPLCAQRCSNYSTALALYVDYGCNLAEEGCQCQPPFRARTAACEEVTCNLQEYLKTQVLAEQLCGSLYEKNETLGSAVSSAIASATSAAFAATVSKSPTNIADYPPCLQPCLSKYIPEAGCKSLADHPCICTNNDPVWLKLGQCEKTSCNSTDLEKLFSLSEELCLFEGDISVRQPLNASDPPGNGSTSYTSTSLPSPSTSPFTGQASANMAGAFAFCMMAVVGLLGAVVLGL